MKQLQKWYTFDKVGFQTALVSFRQGRGVSLRSFAKYMGVTPAMQSRIETGKNVASAEYVAMFCAIANLNCDHFLIVEKSELLAVQKGLGI